MAKKGWQDGPPRKIQGVGLPARGYAKDTVAIASRWVPDYHHLRSGKEGQPVTWGDGWDCQVAMLLKLTLPLKSTEEEFKVLRAREVLQFQELADPKVSGAGVTVRTGTPDFRVCQLTEQSGLVKNPHRHRWVWKEKCHLLYHSIRIYSQLN